MAHSERRYAVFEDIVKDVLECSICMNIRPMVSLQCGHSFCKSCLDCQYEQLRKKELENKTGKKAKMECFNKCESKMEGRGRGISGCFTENVASQQLTKFFADTEVTKCRDQFHHALLTGLFVANILCTTCDIAICGFCYVDRHMGHCCDRKAVCKSYLSPIDPNENEVDDTDKYMFFEAGKRMLVTPEAVRTSDAPSRPSFASTTLNSHIDFEVQSDTRKSERSEFNSLNENELRNSKNLSLSLSSSSSPSFPAIALGFPKASTEVIRLRQLLRYSMKTVHNSTSWNLLHLQRTKLRWGSFTEEFYGKLSLTQSLKDGNCAVMSFTPDVQTSATSYDPFGNKLDVYHDSLGLCAALPRESQDTCPPVLLLCLCSSGSPLLRDIYHFLSEVDHIERDFSVYDKSNVIFALFFQRGMSSLRQTVRFNETVLYSAPRPASFSDPIDEDVVHELASIKRQRQECNNDETLEETSTDECDVDQQVYCEPAASHLTWTIDPSPNFQAYKHLRVSSFASEAVKDRCLQDTEFITESSQFSLGHSSKSDDINITSSNSSSTNLKSHEEQFDHKSDYVGCKRCEPISVDWKSTIGQRERSKKRMKYSFMKFLSEEVEHGNNKKVSVWQNKILVEGLLATNVLYPYIGHFEKQWEEQTLLSEGLQKEVIFFCKHREHVTHECEDAILNCPNEVKAMALDHFHVLLIETPHPNSTTVSNWLKDIIEHSRLRSRWKDQRNHKYYNTDVGALLVRLPSLIDVKGMQHDALNELAFMLMDVYALELISQNALRVLDAEHKREALLCLITSGTLPENAGLSTSVGSNNSSLLREFIRAFHKSADHSKANKSREVSISSSASSSSSSSSSGPSDITSVPSIFPSSFSAGISEGFQADRSANGIVGQAVIDSVSIQLNPDVSLDKKFAHILSAQRAGRSWRDGIRHYLRLVEKKSSSDPIHDIKRDLHKVLRDTSTFRFTEEQIRRIESDDRDNILLALSLDYLECVQKFQIDKNLEKSVRSIQKDTMLEFLPPKTNKGNIHHLTATTMNKFVDDLLHYTVKKKERMRTHGQITPLTIFAPREITTGPTDKRLNEMCIEMCEHFFVEDLLIKEIICNLDRPIKLQVLVAAINRPDKMYKRIYIVEKFKKNAEANRRQKV